jgi:beta-glucosidase
MFRTTGRGVLRMALALTLMGIGITVPARERPVTSVAPVSEENVQARADAPVAQMAAQEKAGELSQYFYFQIFPPMNKAADAALESGAVGSPLFVTDPTEINRLQIASI